MLKLRKVHTWMTPIIALAFFVPALCAFCSAQCKSKTGNVILRYPKQGDCIAPTDYSKDNNWLAKPRSPDKRVDVFFIYPTSWRVKAGQYPLADINNEEMRRWADYYLKTRASAFETAGNIYAPYYRQFDASFLLSQDDDQSRAYSSGVPLTDIVASFEYYLDHFNHGRPFILAAHSQGSMMGLLLVQNCLKKYPGVYRRMIAAYLIGLPITKQDYASHPCLKPAKNADDTGVIVSWNTQAPVVDGKNPLSNPDAVLINPISWKATDEYAPASDSLGSIIANDDGTFTNAPHLADARINSSLGVIISNVDREKFSSAAASRGYFPLGVLHENDIPLFYYDLRHNAENRVEQYFRNKHK